MPLHERQRRVTPHLLNFPLSHSIFRARCCLGRDNHPFTGQRLLRFPISNNSQCTAVCLVDMPPSQTGKYHRYDVYRDSLLNLLSSPFTLSIPIIDPFHCSTMFIRQARMVSISLLTRKAISKRRIFRKQWVY